MNRKLAWSIGILMATASPALAQQTGQAAFDAWLQSYRDLGATASYDSARDSGGTLTVTGLDLSFETTFSIPDPDEDGEDLTLDIDFSWTSEQVVATNMTAEGNLFSVDRMTIADGSLFSVRLDPEGEDDDIVLESRMDGFELIKGTWPALPKLAEDPQRPFSRWLPLLRTIKDTSFEEERVSRLTFDFHGGDSIEGAKVESVVEDLVVRDMHDGRIAEYGTGQVRQETTFPMEDGETYTETTTIAGTAMTGLDYTALLALIDPQARGSGEFKQFIGSVSSNGYRVESPYYDAAVDLSGYENVQLRAPETDLLATLDRLVTSGEEPDPATVILMVVDVYRSISLGRAFADGISFGFDIDPDVTGSGGIGQIVLSNVSADGLEEFSISSMEIDLGTEGSFSLGRFFFGDIEFAPYGPIKAFASDLDNLDEPDPLEVARIFTPRSIAAEIAGLALVGVVPEGDFSLDRYYMDMKSVVPPIPTSFEVSTEGLEMPVAALDDQEVIDVLQAVGIDVLRLTEKIRMRWDPDTEDLIIENLVVELGQIGKVRASARLGGLARSVLENPQQFQALIATLNIKAFELELVNEGGVETALALMAEESDVSENLMAELLLEQLRQALAVIDNEDFTMMVMEAAEAFIDDPRNLSLTIAPGRSIPVSQVAAGVMTAPQMLPELLGVSVEANR
ncbi:hypothetical protein [Nitratireductor sp. XY-223]|uniref:hypothetical protein n=1 Tax=Nitratireductor sp. XY-223 TaxID=2561926 RepID=UPI0010AA2491|nr:hypothetical protein [Nitratireductor sp. XY-223]